MESIVIRDFGLKPYHCVLDDMQRFTYTRTQDSVDQIWYVQHPAVYTRGVSCHDLPWGEGRNLELVDSDRGGQITYHGPGQLIAYLQLDLRGKQADMAIELLQDTYGALLSLIHI